MILTKNGKKTCFLEKSRSHMKSQFWSQFRSQINAFTYEVAQSEPAIPMTWRQFCIHPQYICYNSKKIFLKRHTFFNKIHKWFWLKVFSLNFGLKLTHSHMKLHSLNRQFPWPGDNFAFIPNKFAIFLKSFFWKYTHFLIRFISDSDEKWQKNVIFGKIAFTY